MRPPFDRDHRNETMAEGARFEASSDLETINADLLPSPSCEQVIAESLEEENPVKTDGER